MNIEGRSLAPLLVRLGLGLLLFMAGLGKFLGPGPVGFMAMILKDFSSTFIPEFLLKPYAYLLPFVELALGLFLVAGLYVRTSLLAAGLLFLSLAFGKLVTHDPTTVAQIFLYLFMTAWALCRAEDDTICLDRYFAR